MAQQENQDSMDVQILDLTIEAEPEIDKDEVRADFFRALKLCTFSDTISIDSSDDEEESQQQIRASSSVDFAPACSRTIDPPFVRDQAPTPRASTSDNIATPNASAVPMEATVNAHTSEATGAAVMTGEVGVNQRNVAAISNEVKKGSKDYTEHVQKLREGLIFLVNKEMDDDADKSALHSDRIDEIYKTICMLTRGQELVFEGSKYAQINSYVTELLRKDKVNLEIIRGKVSSLNKEHGYGWSDEEVNTEAARINKEASKIMKKYHKEVKESKFDYIIPLEGFEPAGQEDPELLEQLSKNAELNEQNIQNFMQSTQLFVKWLK